MCVGGGKSSAHHKRSRLKKKKNIFLPDQRLFREIFSTQRFFLCSLLVKVSKAAFPAIFSPFPNYSAAASSLRPSPEGKRRRRERGSRLLPRDAASEKESGNNRVD